MCLFIELDNSISYPPLLTHGSMRLCFGHTVGKGRIRKFLIVVERKYFHSAKHKQMKSVATIVLHNIDLIDDSIGHIKCKDVCI